jgi:hypothetical protein
MRFLAIAAWVAAAVGSLSGCGQTDPVSENAKTTAAISEIAAKMSTGVPSDPIARVVYEFLEAVRQGDTAIAGQRLTPTALQKTQEANLVFSPPGSPTATFKVGNVEMIEKDKAVVDSVWTDLDADGKPHSEPTLWALRLTDGAWRISGMIAEMDPNQPPMVIDFENPETMAPQTPEQPANLVNQPTNSSPSQPPSEVARNPFDQSSPR